jgi:glycosyltransferase involved in cell wall biosynthesis
MEGGGAERQLAYLAGELSRQGCEIHVALTRGGENLPRLQAAGAAIHQIPTSSSHDPRLLTRLRRTMAEVQPDVAHCWLLQMELAAGLAATMSGVPWIFAERSSIGAYPRTVKNYFRVRAAAYSSGIVSNSHGGDSYWRDRQPHVKRYVIGNAVPLEEIERAVVARREEFNAGPSDFCVLYAGRLDSGKNAERLVRALSRIRSERSIRALVCGDGTLRSQLERLVRELGLQAQVRFAGYVQNLWSLLKSADVLVSPSRFEGSPNIVLEAMAAGCPLVVSDIPAHREILDDEAALFVDPDNEAAIADRIISVAADPGTASQRATAARARVERFTLPEIATQYVAVYRDVLANRSRRSLRVA